MRCWARCSGSGWSPTSRRGPPCSGCSSPCSPRWGSCGPTARRAGARRPRSATAFLALLAAYAASGLSLNYLKPRQWDDLVVGLSNGAEALANVQMPYQGADPWPSADAPAARRAPLRAGGAARVLAARRADVDQRPGVQGRGYPFLALALLLVLVAAPVVSLGGTAPLALGIALTALTVCFLWLERLPLRPGSGSRRCWRSRWPARSRSRRAADREEPWFDYKAFAEALGPDEPIAFNWGHSYGPITWPRDGAEVLRVASRRAVVLEGRRPRRLRRRHVGRHRPAGGRAAPTPRTTSRATGTDRVGWRETLRVTLRRLGHAGRRRRRHDARRRGHRPRGRAVERAGPVARDSSFRARRLLHGARYVPRPRAAQLAQSSAGARQPARRAS